LTEPADVIDRVARGILDTSTLLVLRRLADPAVLPSEPLITAVTLAELSVGPLVARDERERAARQAHLQQAEADFEPLPFDRAAARAFGRVAASLRTSGRNPNARAYDALIAATALANEVPLYTCNPSDFSGIDDLEVVAVPIPEDASAT
jgi:tRNA(fMet)-specific endonuclease VapC